MFGHMVHIVTTFLVACSRHTCKSGQNYFNKVSFAFRK